MVTKGDRRRARILEVVTELLATTSFDDITIAEITRRAEVTRPGFYFYFPTKGAAVSSLMENLFAEFESVARIWYEHGGGDQPAALREGLEATVELWRKHATVMHGMMQAAAADVYATEIMTHWIAAFTARAVPTIAADAGPRIAASGTRVEEVAQLLVDATFAAMGRDVRAVVETGSGDPRMVETLSFVWRAALYQH